MFEVTPRATRLITDHFKDREKSPIRVFVRIGGCGIRRFGVALEKPRNSDRIFNIDGTIFVINRKLYDMVRPIRMDADGIGFLISGSGIAPTGGCGVCGGMCGLHGASRCPADCARCPYQCAHGQRLKKRAMEQT